MTAEDREIARTAPAWWTGADALLDAPICPHCGHAETDAWEWNFGGTADGEHEGDCNSCGEPFRTERIVYVNYKCYAVAIDATEGVQHGEAK